jgi:thiaminase/transcriptional activator TenA
MSQFSEKAWASTAALRAAILHLPFNTELAAGTLAPERFRFYILQDAIYLGEYARVLAIAAAKAPDATTVQVFAGDAVQAIAVEQALHGRYLAEFGVTPEAAAAAEPSPDCLAYTSFLLATAHQQPWPVLVAAVLPCFWIYWDVASAIVRSEFNRPLSIALSTEGGIIAGAGPGTSCRIIGVSNTARPRGSIG